MLKTLVIILAETRSHEKTYENFHNNVLLRLNADLCICIGVKQDYDYNNPFFINAKYHFLFNEPDDFAEAFDYAEYSLNNFKKYINGINNIENIDTKIKWRDFLNIHKDDQFMGGILDDKYQHSGSAGILIFFRWFLLKKILENDIISKYDRFIITRSDYIYRLPHIQMEILDEDYIWIPDAEDHGGFTDRHVVLSKKNIIQYLNILNHLVLHSHNYYDAMKESNLTFNLETLIKFHLTYQGLINNVRRIPYIMYTIRLENGSTRWAKGKWSDEHNYYIKYEAEYAHSYVYKSRFDSINLSIDNFYDFILPFIQNMNTNLCFFHEMM